MGSDFGRSKACPYCQGDFKLSCEGEHISQGNQVFTDSYSCTECAETFVINRVNEELTSFQFTCNKLWISICIEQNKLQMSVLQNETDGGPIPYIEMPAFIPDFSDKDKLFNKLRTYLIFS